MLVIFDKIKDINFARINITNNKIILQDIDSNVFYL